MVDMGAPPFRSVVPITNPKFDKGHTSHNLNCNDDGCCTCTAAPVRRLLFRVLNYGYCRKRMKASLNTGCTARLVIHNSMGFFDGRAKDESDKHDRLTSLSNCAGASQNRRDSDPPISAFIICVVGLIEEHVSFRCCYVPLSVSLCAGT